MSIQFNQTLPFTQEMTTMFVLGLNYEEDLAVTFYFVFLFYLLNQKHFIEMNV